MYRRRKLAIPATTRTQGGGIEFEVFVAGVLAILLALAAVRAFLPAVMLPAIGVAAFFALLLTGLAATRAPRRSTRTQTLSWGIGALFAIVWIAAGRLAGAGHLERWFQW